MLELLSVVQPKTTGNTANKKNGVWKVKVQYVAGILDVRELRRGEITQKKNNEERNTKKNSLAGN